ncbi:helix-turn-helix domain-containing protein [Streptomyces sp. NPDC087659]|uniref:helix-turn-helix domain-containing protein n=1 Tax=Streptomyces sp. NPDC087659 TaxID=3365801 RepID=UPI00381908C0
MSNESFLGEFLRARRGGIKPEDAGLPAHESRRVPGLRREEVACLAGISTDYYIRLEQGRETNPSPQVLDAVARALQLDGDAAEHARRLVTAQNEPARRPDTELVSPHLLQIMDYFDQTPAFVLGSAMDFLACNPMARALHGGFDAIDNFARMVFVDPAGRCFFRDWVNVAETCVSELRAAFGINPYSDRIREVVETLSAQSGEFVELWETHLVRRRSRGEQRLNHPVVGLLDVQYSVFNVNDAPEQQLVVHQAGAASLTATALRLLGEGIGQSAGPGALHQA